MSAVKTKKPPRPKLPARITVKWLQARRACAGQVEDFRRLFGDSAETTVANMRTALRAGLSVGWLLEVADTKLDDATFGRWMKKGLPGEYADFSAAAIARIIRSDQRIRAAARNNREK